MSISSKLLNRLNESVNLYIVEYTYDGDSISDYIGRIGVMASSPEEAVYKAKMYKYHEKFFTHKSDNAYAFRVRDKYNDTIEYGKKYPNNNTKILVGYQPEDIKR